MTRRVVIGVGARRDVPVETVREAVSHVLGAAGIRVRDIEAVVTAETKAGEAGIDAVAGILGVPVRAFGAETLAGQAVPNPSAVVGEAVGTPSVAEAAVLAAGADLTHPKHVIGPVTVALGHLPEPAAGDSAAGERAAARGEEPGEPGWETGARSSGGGGPGGRAPASGEVDLGFHGDSEVGDGLVDLAVNVRGPAPGWLADRLKGAVDRLAPYPDPRAATAAVAARHGRPPAEVLLTAGAAEAFVLLARALNPRRAVVVHPQFTEPEAALRAAGHAVERVILEPPFLMNPAAVPADADLVVVGNPTNPTSVLHPRETLERLVRPGRIVLVDEAFMDAVPGEAESLAGTRRAGLVVVRSLTKTWGLAGLRIGYLLGDEKLVEMCARAQPLWSVGTLALEAALACSTPAAIEEAEHAARTTEEHREALLRELDKIDHIEVTEHPKAPFVLIRAADGVHRRLREQGWAVRRADTFPGLGPAWIRVAVRDPDVSARFARALGSVVPDRTPTGRS